MQQQQETTWPLLQSESEVPRIPMDGFPETFQNMVTAITEDLKVPRDMAWGSVYGTLSAFTMGHTVKIVDGWSQPCGEWVIVCAASASNKTACMEKSLPGGLETPPVTADSTPEGLLKKLQRNQQQEDSIVAGGRAWLRTAEGRVLDTALGTRYGDGAASLLLQCYSGEEYAYDRATGGSMTLVDPRISMLVFTQPGALESLVRDKRTRDQGAWGRTLFVYPDSNVGRRDWTEISNKCASAAPEWKKSLLKIPEPTEDFEFSGSASTLLACNRNVWEYEMISRGSNIQDWVGKAAGHEARMAASIALLEGKTRVEDEHVAVAHEAMLALLLHARRCLAPEGRSTVDPDTHKLLTQLWRRASKGQTVASERTLYRGAHLKANVAHRILRNLWQAGYVQPAGDQASKGCEWVIRPSNLWNWEG